MSEEDDEKVLLVLEIMALAYAVDRRTDYAVFIDYSGHVEHLDVRIVRSKADWRDELATTEFNVNGKYQLDGLGWLKVKRDQMKAILDEGEVDTSDMEAIATTTYEYAF